AQDEGDEELAARLAERAELDAAYAIALSDSESAQAAVEELRATLATLESELQRNQTPPSAGDEIGSRSDDIEISLRDEELDAGPSSDDIDPPGEIAPGDLPRPDPVTESPDDTLRNGEL